MVIVSRRRRQRAVDAPPEMIDSSMQRGLMQALSRGPDVQWERFTVVGQKLDASRVRILLLRRGPAHVARLVVAVVIDTVDRVLRRGARPDVGQEAFERVAPGFADVDASTAVVWEARAGRRVAAIFHTGPSAMFRRARQSVRGVVVGPQTIEAVTTAGACVSAFQVGQFSHECRAAIAAAQRAPMLPVAGRDSDQDEMAKSLPDEMRGPRAWWHERIVPRDVTVEAV